MSPAGWPKGKPRGPLSPEHIGKLRAGRVRARYLKRLREVEIASGRSLGGGLNTVSAEHPFEPKRGASIDTTPAAWRPATQYIRDYEYVDGNLDDDYMRALPERVVYAGSACCHHESPFQDITIKTLAATELAARKYKIPRRPTPKPRVFIVPRPRIVVIKEWPAVKAALERRAKFTERVGTSLTAVVAEMFPEIREGKYLTEVVSELFDS